MKKIGVSKKLDTIDKKLDQLLSLEKEGAKEEEETQDLEKQELKDIDELQDELNKLDINIKKEIGAKALTKVTLKDISKGVVGAFIGIVSHFAFFEGAHIAEGISNLRAVFLLITSLLIGTIFIYFTGYRKIKVMRLLYLVPLRVIVIYLTALFTIVFVLFIYGIIEHPSVSLLFKQLAVISIPAMLGASAADLIGRE